jgi:hypothetical protein
VRQLLSTLCVALSLVLFALCDTYLTKGFCLSTLSSSRPRAIVGPILDTVAISLIVEGMIREESGRHVSIYNTFYCILQGFVASSPWL